MHSAFDAVLPRTRGRCVITRPVVGIATLTQGIADLDKSVAEATETRKEEAAEYTSTKSQNSAAVQLLEVAKNQLNKFYNPKSPERRGGQFVLSIWCRTTRSCVWAEGRTRRRRSVSSRRRSACMSRGKAVQGVAKRVSASCLRIRQL